MNHRRSSVRLLGAVALGAALTIPSLTSRSAEPQTEPVELSFPDGESGIVAGASTTAVLAYAESADDTASTPADASGQSTAPGADDEGVEVNPDPEVTSISLDERLRGDSPGTSSEPGALAVGIDQARQAGAIRELLVEQAEDLTATPVGIRGRVAGPRGPVAQAVVRIGEKLATTDDQGLFWLDAVDRKNELVAIDADGYYSRSAAAMLSVPAGSGLVDLGTISLSPRSDDSLLVLAGGDVSFGRRYLDPEGSQRNDRVPDDNPGALIRPSNARNDTTRLLAELAETFNPYDLVTVSLESVVTGTPPPANPDRQNHLFSLPRSLDALASAGVDHVALGNDKILDFGALGIEQTRAALDDDGTGHSGAGATVSEAVLPWAVEVGGSTAALSSFAAVEGATQANPFAASIAGAGAADLNDNAIAELALRQAAALDVSIAHAHTGYEFTESPGAASHARERLSFLARSGADLVVGHHPNVAQGFEFVGDSLVAHSLGNLVFDQSRIDGAIGALLETRWQAGSLDGAAVLPVLLDDFVPTRLVGDPADLVLRRLAHASADDIVFAPDFDRATIHRRENATAVTRTVTVTPKPDGFGTAVIDLRAVRRPHESVSGIAGADGATVSLGRDLLIFGGVEDIDTDADNLEVPYWSLTGNASFACVDERARGTQALCSVRSASHRTASTIGVDTPVRVLGDRLNNPSKDLTLVTHSAGSNRGDVYIDAIWRASVGSREFGSEQVLALPAGTTDYAMSWVDLQMPADDPAILATPELPFGTKLRRENARAVELRIRHLPPNVGTGVAMIDDVAIVSWVDPAVEAIASVSTPNPYDFLRVEGIEPGRPVEVTFTSWTAGVAATLAPSDPLAPDDAS